MRNALINWLTEKAKSHPEIVLITGDLGYSVLEPFIEAHKSNYFNSGVAEQNMTGISAGLALEGFRPYNYSIGIFPTFRCAEQIRNDIDYHNLPVVICAIGSGVAYGNLGYSHHAIQDLTFMRSLPNMIIGTPCDPQQVIEILDYHFENPKPLYLRLHKAGENNQPWSHEEVKPGQLKRLITVKGRGVGESSPKSCIICIGHIAEKVIKQCNIDYKEYAIYSVPLWGPSSNYYYAEQISKYETIITVEDHVLEGGFGSYTLEAVARYRLNARVIPIAIEHDIVGKVAKEETLLKPIMANLQSALKNKSDKEKRYY